MAENEKMASSALLSEARRDYIARRFERATTKYRQVIEAEPTNLRAFNGLVRSLAQLRLYTEAVQVCQQVLELDHGQAMFHMLLGSIYRSQERYELGEQEVQKAIEIDPSFVDAYITLGALLSDQKRFPEAEAIYKTAIALDPKSWMAWTGLSMNYDRQNRFGEATKMARCAFQANPSLRTMKDLFLTYHAAYRLLINTILALCILVSLIVGTLWTLPFMLIFVTAYLVGSLDYFSVGNPRQGIINGLFVLAVIVLYMVNLLFGPLIKIF